MFSEREKLQNDINRCSDLIHGYNKLMYTLTSGVLTYGASQDEPMALLIPSVFIVAIYVMVEGIEKDICKIATYISTFFEIDTKNISKWETRVQEYDEVNRKGKRRWGKGLVMYLTCLWLCAVFSIYKICLLWSKYSCLGVSWRIIVALVWTVLCTLFCIRIQVNYYELRENEKEKWQKVIKEEDGKKEEGIV